MTTRVIDRKEMDMDLENPNSAANSVFSTSRDHLAEMVYILTDNLERYYEDFPFDAPEYTMIKFTVKR